MVLIYKTIDVGTVSAGATEEGNVSSDDQYTLKYVIAVEKGGTDLYNVTATLRIDDFTFTKDKIPLSILQRPVNQLLELNYDFTKGKTLYYSITNNLTSDVNIFLVLVLELPE